MSVIELRFELLLLLLLLFECFELDFRSESFKPVSGLTELLTPEPLPDFDSFESFPKVVVKPLPICNEFDVVVVVVETVVVIVVVSGTVFFFFRCCNSSYLLSTTALRFKPCFCCC